MVITPAVLCMSVTNDKSRFDSYTSKTAAGSALFQFQQGQWVLIGYLSKKLPNAVHNCYITELEMTGFVCNIYGFSQLYKLQYFEILFHHKDIENL